MKGTPMDPDRAPEPTPDDGSPTTVLVTRTEGAILLECGKCGPVEVGEGDARDIAYAHLTKFHGFPPAKES